jgi:hypothetical protein
MPKPHLVVVWLVAATGCGSLVSSQTYPGPTTTSAEGNPCATAGAAYTMLFSEVSGGTCGALSEEVFVMSATGDSYSTTSWTPVTCGQDTQRMCSSQESDCYYWALNGAKCSLSTDLTYEKDGSSAKGIRMLSCRNIPIHVDGGPDSGPFPEVSCLSTYKVAVTRQ